MGRKIRLTESQFRRMVAKIVKESKYEYDEEIIEDEDMEDEGEDISKQEAVKKIADFLKSEVLPDLSPKQLSMLKRKSSDLQSPMESMNEQDDEDDLKSRRSNRIEKGMMRGGLGLAGASAVALLGEFMGYSEFELTSMLHDINHMAGLGRYTGPVGVGLVALGLAAALKGLDMRMRRTGK